MRTQAEAETKAGSADPDRAYFRELGIEEAYDDEELREQMQSILDIAPQDDLEMMLSVKLVVAHRAACECFRGGIAGGVTPDGFAYLKLADRLSRTFVLMLGALDRHRERAPEISRHRLMRTDHKAQREAKSAKQPSGPSALGAPAPAAPAPAAPAPAAPAPATPVTAVAPAARTAAQAKSAKQPSGAPALGAPAPGAPAPSSPAPSAPAPSAQAPGPSPVPEAKSAKQPSGAPAPAAPPLAPETESAKQPSAPALAPGRATAPAAPAITHTESEKQPPAPPVVSARARLEPGIPDPTRPGQTIYTVRPEERDQILAALQAETRAQLKEPSVGTIASLPDPVVRSQGEGKEQRHR
jgi:hypothetical protein